MVRFVMDVQHTMEVQKPMPNTIVYVAAPYTDSDPAVREKRFESACRAAAELTRQGKTVIAPTVFGHHVCRYGLPFIGSFGNVMIENF